MAGARTVVRVSTNDQQLSPDAQRAAMTAWAGRTKTSILSEHEDIGVSGGAGLDKRPGLLSAIDLLQRGELLVVARRDRLGRDALLLAMIEASVARKGARIVSVVGEGTDGDEPTQVLMRRIVDAFSEYERLVLKARTKSALRVKQMRGERTGSVPYGFALAEDGVHLVNVAAEQAVVAQALGLHRDGLSLRAVARRLDSLGMRSRTGRTFLASQVARIIRTRALQSPGERGGGE